VNRNRKPSAYDKVKITDEKGETRDISASSKFLLDNLMADDDAHGDENT
jgi:hypothetical protein